MFTWLRGWSCGRARDTSSQMHRVLAECPMGMTALTVAWKSACSHINCWCR